MTLADHLWIALFNYLDHTTLHKHFRLCILTRQILMERPEIIANLLMLSNPYNPLSFPSSFRLWISGIGKGFMGQYTLMHMPLEVYKIYIHKVGPVTTEPCDFYAPRKDQLLFLWPLIRHIDYFNLTVGPVRYCFLRNGAYRICIQTSFGFSWCPGDLLNRKDFDINTI